MERWYVLHTKPHAEYRVATILRQRALQIYLPESVTYNARQERKRAPFFPSYLFLKTDFEVVGLSRVQWTPGLHRVLTFGDRPIPVSDKVVDIIRRKLGEINANGNRPAHTFKPGDTVRITDGPFRDMLAIFEGPTTPSQRVQVLLDILGYANRVQVDVADLEKAPFRAEAPRPKRLRRTRGRGRRIEQTAEQV